jgi:hypothetical protein
MTLLETASNIVVPDQLSCADFPSIENVPNGFFFFFFFVILNYRGEAWQRLRQEDFSQVDLDSSPELLELIKNMMRTEPEARMNAEGICRHEVVTRTRRAMERKRKGRRGEDGEQGGGGGGDGGSGVETWFAGSPLSGVPRCFLMEILGRPGGRSGGGNGSGGEIEERREGEDGYQ